MGKETELLKAVKANDTTKLLKALQPDKGNIVKSPTSRSNSLKNWSTVTSGQIQVQIDHLDINTHEDKTGYTPLIIAALNGNLDICEMLLYHLADINSKDSKGNTALHMAVFGGHRDLVVFMLEKEAKVDETNSDGNSPVHIVCQNDCNNKALVILNELFKVNANVCIANRNGETPLDLASMYNKKSIVSALMDHQPGLRSNTSAIIEATKRGLANIVTLLLDYGVDPNNMNITKGTAALHEGVRYCRSNVVKVLTEYGARWYLQNERNETPEILILDLPIAKRAQFSTLCEESATKEIKLPQYLRQSNVPEIPQKVKDFPALPVNYKWIENTPKHCSSSTPLNPNTNLVDGNPSSLWVIPELHHAWTILDLQEPHIITGIGIYGWNSSKMAKNIKLQKGVGIHGPWITVTNCACELQGGTSPQDPGILQYFRGFTDASQFFRLLIIDNHGGSCICFHGIELYGAETRVIKLLESFNMENIDAVVKKGYNTYMRLIAITEINLQEFEKNPTRVEAALKALNKLRLEEFPMSRLAWLRVPVSHGENDVVLPVFSVQSDAGVVGEVEVYVEGAPVGGDSKVMMIPSEKGEASVALFQNIKICAVGTFTIRVRSVQSRRVTIAAPEQIMIKPRAHRQNEVDAAFDDIQSMLQGLQESLQVKPEEEFAAPEIKWD